MRSMSCSNLQTPHMGGPPQRALAPLANGVTHPWRMYSTVPGLLTALSCARPCAPS